MTSLITREYNVSPGTGKGHVFTFRGDGWFNMTKAAQVFGKRLDEFWSNKEAVEYILALGNVNAGDSREYPAAKTRYVEASRGRHGGTWAHPKLAVFFARWLDVRFSVWCDAVIGDILKGAATVVITKPQ
jgi:hypothetical protein